MESSIPALFLQDASGYRNTRVQLGPGKSIPLPTDVPYEGRSTLEANMASPLSLGPARLIHSPLAMVENEISTRSLHDADIVDWLEYFSSHHDELLTEIHKLPTLDIRRAKVLEPMVIRSILNSEEIHLNVAASFKLFFDMTMIYSIRSTHLYILEHEYSNTYTRTRILEHIYFKV